MLFRAGGVLCGTGAGQDVPKPVVPLVTRILVDRTLRPRHRNVGGPGSRERRRVVHRELIVDRVGIDAPEPLDQMRVPCPCQRQSGRRKPLSMRTRASQRQFCASHVVSYGLGHRMAPRFPSLDHGARDRLPTRPLRRDRPHRRGRHGTGLSFYSSAAGRPLRMLSRPKRELLFHGAVLILLGLLSGLVAPAVTNPRMGLSGSPWWGIERDTPTSTWTRLASRSLVLGTR